MTIDDLLNSKQTIIDCKCSLNNLLDKILDTIEEEIKKHD